MTDPYLNYWDECIRVAFEESNIVATDEQIKEVAGAVQSSHENYSMAFGYDNIPSPLEDENSRLKRDLETEKRKVACPECKGRGAITETFGPRSGTFRCPRCNGEGKTL